MNTTTRAFVAPEKVSTASAQSTRSSGSALAERHGELLELVQPRVDQLPLERRNDDQVGGPERSSHDCGEGERETDADPARNAHSGLTQA